MVWMALRFLRMLSGAAVLCAVNCREPSVGPPPATAIASRSSESSRAVLVGLPPRADVLAALRLAHDQFARNWPDPTVDVVTDRTRPSNLHTRAVYYEGLLALYAVET